MWIGRVALEHTLGLGLGCKVVTGVAILGHGGDHREQRKDEGDDDPGHGAPLP